MKNDEQIKSLVDSAWEQRGDLSPANAPKVGCAKRSKNASTAWKMGIFALPNPSVSPGNGK